MPPATLGILTSLTYKGTDLQAFPRIFFWVVSGGPDSSPEVRGADSTTPYLAGQHYGPKRADRLPIMLEGWVAGAGDDEDEQRADTATARREMFTLFDVEGGPGELSLTTEDGTVWTIQPYPEAFVPDYEPPAPTHVGISVRLIAIEPPTWEAEAS